MIGSVRLEMEKTAGLLLNRRYNSGVAMAGVGYTDSADKIEIAAS
jgi:hypothetical protein